MGLDLSRLQAATPSTLRTQNKRTTEAAQTAKITTPEVQKPTKGDSLSTQTTDKAVVAMRNLTQEISGAQNNYINVVREEALVLDTKSDTPASGVQARSTEVEKAMVELNTANVAFENEMAANMATVSNVQNAAVALASDGTATQIPLSTGIASPIDNTQVLNLLTE